MNNFFADLKRGTASSHTALEAAYPFNTMMKPEAFDREAYTQNLMILASFHEYVSSFVKDFEPYFQEINSFMDSDGVMDALNQDLTELQHTARYPTFPGHLPAKQDEAALAGAYVWMGSSMGAKILYRWLNHAGFETLPMAYYQQMISIGQQWPAFIERGTALANQRNLDSDACITYANQLFEGLRICADTLEHKQRHPA